MTTTTDNTARNGVDTVALFTTIGAVKAQPELAKFQFRATNRWVDGTHNRGTINGYRGAGQEHVREQDFSFPADHPPVLNGGDHGPTPVEYVLHALAACLTAGLANIAAARGVTLTDIQATMEGDIDLCGIFGLGGDARNGFEQIRVHFTVAGDAPAEKLRELVEQSRRRSAVFDIVTNAVPVTIDVTTR